MDTTELLAVLTDIRNELRLLRIGTPKQENGVCGYFERVMAAEQDWYMFRRETAEVKALLAACRRELGLRQVWPFWRQERQPARQFCRFAGHVTPCLPVQWRRFEAFNCVTALLNARLASPGRG